MTGAAVVMVGVAVVLTLMLLLQLSVPVGDDEDEAEGEGEGAARPPSVEARVERYIGLLNYGDDATAAEASRHLLSMGSHILPVLMRHLGRLEERAGALSPQCQLRLEELLTSFGLVAWLECGELMRDIHRASPVYPAMMRVFGGIGPNLLVEVSRHAVVEPLGLLGPLMYRMGDALERPLVELLRARPHDLPAEVILAALPVFIERPGLLGALAERLPLSGRERLLGVLARWGSDEALALLAGLVPHGSSALLAAWIGARAAALAASGDTPALLELASAWRSRHREPDPDPDHLHALTASLDALPLDAALAWLDAADRLPAAWPGLDAAPPALIEWSLSALDGDDPAARRLALRALGRSLSDPRALERLIAEASDTRGALGGLALAELAAAQAGPLEDLVAARLRSVEVDDLEVFHLRLTTLRAPARIVPVLGRLLRSDSPRPVGLAALLLSTADVPTEIVLKALGRHRYSPLEAAIAPLLWARWAPVRDALRRCLADADREVRQGALDVLLGYGQKDDAPDLLARLPHEGEGVGSLANAVEMIGPGAEPALAAFLTEHPELGRTLGLPRRLELLRCLRRGLASPHPARHTEAKP